jgi:hypothetical protein
MIYEKSFERFAQLSKKAQHDPNEIRWRPAPQGGFTLYDDSSDDLGWAPDEAQAAEMAQQVGRKWRDQPDDSEFEFSESFPGFDVYTSPTMTMIIGELEGALFEGSSYSHIINEDGNIASGLQGLWVTGQDKQDVMDKLVQRMGKHQARLMSNDP